MMRKFKKRWLLILVFISILSASAFNRRYKQVNAEEADTTVVTPYKKPSGNATKFLGIWLTSGYTLQPATNTYIEVGQTKSISGNAGRSMLQFWATIGYTNKRYQWYKSTDGKNWSKVSDKESGNKKTLSFTPTKEGDTYYQLDTYWQTGGLFGLTASHLYSNVATVHAVPEPVNAQSVKVTVDDDYLYNSVNDLINIETVAHAHPDPENFTGTVTWSVDNPNLATIDEETGEVTANTSRLSGVVTVTATLHNPDGTTKQGSETITIGGGLENQTVHAGETATFDLRGNVGDLDEDGDNNYTVKWYKEDPITHSREQIQKDDPKALSYTTPATTLNDDGTLILAIIQLRYGGKNYSYTTNDAYLYVIPEGGPEIELTNTLTNETFTDESNTATWLFGVNNNDTIKYTDTVTNKSTSDRLKDAKYVLPLRTGTRVTSVKLDGKDVDSDKYSLTENDTTKDLDLTISDLQFDINQSHKIEVETIVTGITQRSRFRTIPYVTGTASGDKAYQKIGSEEYLNYTTNSVELDPVENFDYGTINSYGSNNLLKRKQELNSPNNIVEVDDMRRSKKAAKIIVNQDGPMTNEAGDVLAGQLRYYSDGNYTNLNEQDAVVSEVDDDEPLSSFSWDPDDGILLFLESKLNAAGNYHTKITWSVQESI